jgi:hypothetical protein
MIQRLMRPESVVPFCIYRACDPREDVDDTGLPKKGMHDCFQLLFVLVILDHATGRADRANAA